MDQFTVIFPPHPLVSLIIMIACSVASVYFFKRYQAINFAKWVADEGQYQPLAEHILNDAIQEADEGNRKTEFLRYLVIIRTSVGHQNLKIGHLYWIWDQMGKKVRAEGQTEIPTFDQNGPAFIHVSGSPKSVDL